MLMSGGEKITSVKIENAFCCHVGVQEVASVA